MLVPVAARATPVSGPREAVDEQFTTMKPGSPTGFRFTGTYHAAGNPHGAPPYMRRMIGYSPAGNGYDTSVPAICSAGDSQLAIEGPSACPPGSRIGGGTTDSEFMGMFESRLEIDVFNNTDQQIFLTRSPFLTAVSRGQIRPDGSIEFDSPTCFPSSPLISHCPSDNALQLRSHIVVPPYTRVVHGVRRSYLTTASYCPCWGYWRTPIRFWWADGGVDTVLTRQPCQRVRHRRRRHGHRRGRGSR
jgi:hypothetical protein